MKKWLIVNTRDAFESHECQAITELAVGLQTAGNTVNVFLVENGVLSARRGTEVSALTQLLKGGIDVAVDAFSARERGLNSDSLSPGIELAPINYVLDRLSDNWHVIWR
jgi:sulfur relay (sulfurtransferase) complex TusBCD TusD component (DsrE family)